jgi:DNA-binding transcriptional ArsR family regulator
MKMTEMVMQSDQAIVGEAQNRANVSAFLNQNPGVHNVNAVAKATGLSAFIVGRALKEMADGGLIHVRRHGTHKFYSSAPIGDDRLPSTTRLKVRAKKSTKKDQHAERVNQKLRAAEADTIMQMTAKPRPAPTKAKEIELVIDGILIIAGRNPATGRLRVVLEG